MIVPLIVSGFLGAGKTNFVRKILPAVREAGYRPTVLIYEPSDTSFDSSLLARFHPRLVIQKEPKLEVHDTEQLLRAVERVPDSEEGLLIIETNGVVDPVEILEPLKNDPRAEHLSDPLHISIVDCTMWQRHAWHNLLEMHLFRSATHFFLSKTDLVDEERTFEVRKKFSNANSYALEIDTISFVHLLNSTEVASPVYRRNPAFHRDQNFTFFTLNTILPERTSQEALTEALDHLPINILYAKGAIVLEETGPVVFHKLKGMDDILLTPLLAAVHGSKVATLVGIPLPPESCRDLFKEIF